MSRMISLPTDTPTFNRNFTAYKCNVCGQIYADAMKALSCMEKPITHQTTIKPGDTFINLLDGRPMIAKDVIICKSNYNDTQLHNNIFWHTPIVVGIRNPTDKHNTINLTYDQYLPYNFLYDELVIKTIKNAKK